MDALHRAVTTVHIIKLHFLNIRLDFAQHLVIRTCEIHHIAHHPASHGKDERFVGGIGVEAYLLVEGTHLLGIIHRLYHEALACGNALLGIFHLGAAATLQHVVDNQRLVSLVLHHELSRYGMAELHLSAVHHLVLGCYLLRRCWQRQQR